MAAFTSVANATKGNPKHKIKPPLKIEHDRYNMFYAVDGTTADKMIAVVYIRKDTVVTTPGTIVFNYT